jgi:hypothetical protein
VIFRETFEERTVSYTTGNTVIHIVCFLKHEESNKQYIFMLKFTSFCSISKHLPDKENDIQYNFCCKIPKGKFEFLT